MKKIFLFLVLTIMAFGETVAVNMDYLINHHPKFETTKKDIDTEKTRLETLINNKANELSLLKASLDAKQDKVTDEEVQDFYKEDQELQKMYSEAQSSLISFKDKKIQSLYNEIINAVMTLQKVKKYSAIVEKTAVYAGAENLKDVSEEVLKTLQSSEKINLF